MDIEFQNPTYQIGLLNDIPVELVFSEGYNWLLVGYQACSLIENLTVSPNHPVNGSKTYSLEEISKSCLNQQDSFSIVVCSVDIDASTIRMLIQKLNKRKYDHIVVLYAKSFSRDHIIKARNLKLDEYLYADLGWSNILERVKFLASLKSRFPSLAGRKPSSLPVQISKKSFAKSLLDISVSFLLLLFLSPLFLLIIFLIKVESKGPAFFVSKRVGANYNVFNFYKFRTMKVGANEMRSELGHLNSYSTAEEYIHNVSPFFFKIKNDPRVTKIGKILRKTSLDELPQLINVLKGDMSLVGIRPLPLDEAASLTRDQWAARFLAPSGITGLWQTSKEKETMSVNERISLDLDYRNKMSLTSDLKILLKTIPSMLQQE